MLPDNEQAVSRSRIYIPLANRRLWVRLAEFLPLLLPVILLVPALASFPYPSPDARYSDLVISHYPNAVFLRQAILRWHSVPLWSPTILSGYPFDANPLSGLWYPPGWLALAIPLPQGFNLLVLCHLLWGGLGLYTLLRQEGLSRPAAVLGGAAFAALPKLFAHYGAGHLTLLYAVPWTPWLLAASDRSLSPQARRPENRWLEFVFQPALVLALIFLADVRWAVFAGVLWAGYYFFQDNGFQAEPLVGTGSRRGYRFFHRFSFLMQQVILAAFLAAPLALPLLEYTRLSTRLALQPQDVLAFSLPPSRLLGLIFPDLGGFHEWVLYPGAVIMLLALLALVWSRWLPRAGFWVASAGLAILFSLGSFLPGSALLAQLPGANLLRVPPRALFLAGLALVAAAAHAMNALLSTSAEAGKKAAFRRRSIWVLVSVPAFAAAFSLSLWGLLGAPTLSFLWGALILLLSAGWVLLRLIGRVSPSAWAAGLFVLCLLDLGVMDLSLFSRRPADQVFAERQSLAEHIASLPGSVRVYSPSYSLPQQTAARFGLQLVDGVDPLQLQAYVAFMQLASGVPVKGYSVTLPPLAGETNLQGGEPASADASTANAAYLPDPEKLGMLNAGYIASEFPLQIEGLELNTRVGSTYLYENRLVKPIAWIQRGDQQDGESIFPAEITLWSPNRIEVSVNNTAEVTDDRLALLVLSELAYPGWRAWVDGQPAAIQAYEGVLRAVRLPPGNHRVTFRFQPLSVFAGVACSFLGVVGLLFTGRKNRRSSGVKSSAISS